MPDACCGGEKSYTDAGSRTAVNACGLFLAGGASGGCGGKEVSPVDTMTLPQLASHHLRKLLQI